MSAIIIKVIGMSCSGCANSVEIALKNVSGVQNAAVDLQEEKAFINYDEGIVSIDKLKIAIEDAGYETA